MRFVYLDKLRVGWEWCKESVMLFVAALGFGLVLARTSIVEARMVMSWKVLWLIFSCFFGVESCSVVLSWKVLFWIFSTLLWCGIVGEYRSVGVFVNVLS